MKTVGRNLRFLLVWTASALNISVAHSQTLSDPIAPAREGAALVALSTARGVAAPDPARLDQYFDASPRRRALEVAASPGSRSRHRRRKPSAPSRRPAAVLAIAQTHRSLIVHVPPTPSPAYARTLRLLQSRPEVTDRYDELILKYSWKYGLDPRLVKSIMAAESEFCPTALSPAGASGLMQLKAPTAEEMGVPGRRLADPESNIRAGVAYIRLLFRAAWKTFHLQGSNFQQAPLWLVQRVIAAYHAGPRFLSVGWWYGQTRSYIQRVLIFYRSKITDLRRPAPPRGSSPKISMYLSSDTPHY